MACQSIKHFLLQKSQFFLGVVPPLFDRLVNRTRMRKPYAISTEAQTLHRQLRIADLHCDALNASRDLLTRSAVGHVDLPRLKEGNVAIQAFTIPTQAPVRAGVPWLPLDWDALTFIVVGQRWPMPAWESAFERVLYAAQRLHDLKARADGRFRIIASTKELDAYLVDRNVDPALTAGFLGVEGLHCIEGSLEKLDALYEVGVRMAGLVHLAGNDIGGAAHGIRRGGLTPFGEQVIQRLEQKRIVIDLAHASPKLLEDVLNIATRPLVVSHTGFTGVYNNDRNLGDAHARRIAEQGGVIGVGYFPWATGGRNVASIIKTILYGAKLVGPDHLALGSDFDGAVTTPFDASGIALITDALSREGMNRQDIANIMGENALRLLRQTLPPE